MTATLFWPAAVLRALSPARLLAVLLGLALTQLLLAIPLLVQQQPFSFLQLPWELVQELVAGGSRKVVFWGLILGGLIGAIWGLAGGWIAWLEYRAQIPDELADSVFTFLQRKAHTLCMPVVLVLLFVSLLIVLGWVASAINLLLPWGIGATLLALSLPFLMLLAFVVVVCVVGCVALPIMPAATAAEGSGSFDAVSRGFTYLFQRPLEYALWWGLALLLASLPLAGGLSLARGEQPLVSPQAGLVLLWIGLIVSLALFWSLQPLVYVKMRRRVDHVEETELWTGVEEETQPTPPPPLPEEERGRKQPLSASRRGGGRVEPVSPIESPPEQLIPARDHFTFNQTLTLGNAGAPNKLVGLLPGIAWTALVLAGGLCIVSRLDPVGAEWNLAGLREMVLRLAQDRPLVLVVVFLGAVVLASLVLGRPMRMISRLVAVRAVYQQEISLIGRALPFVRRTAHQGLVSVLLLSAATVLYLAGLLVACLVWEDPNLCPELCCLAIVALLLGAPGALGLGTVAVDGRRLEENKTATREPYLTNGAELLASALAAVGMGALRWAALFALAWLTWFFVCESLGWMGGPAEWVRWGLDGRLVPDVRGPLYSFASWIAGLWFFILFGVVLSYPLSYLLRWGVVCYLRSRQRTAERNAELLDLDEEERSELLQRQTSRKRQRRP